MRDFIGQPYGDTHMRAENRVTESRRATVRGSIVPPLPIGRIKLKWFADVVTNGARYQNSPVDDYFGVRGFEILCDGFGIAHYTTRVVSLAAAPKDRRPRIAFRRNIGDPLEIRAAK